MSQSMGFIVFSMFVYGVWFMFVGVAVYDLRMLMFLVVSFGVGFPVSGYACKTNSFVHI